MSAGIAAYRFLRLGVQRVRKEEWCLFGLWAVCILLSFSSKLGFHGRLVFDGYFQFFAGNIVYLFAISRIAFRLEEHWLPTSLWGRRIHRWIYGEGPRASVLQIDLDFIRCAFLLFTTLTIYTNIKIRIPFLNDAVGDALFLDLDHLLFGERLVPWIERTFAESPATAAFFEGIYMHGYIYMSLLVLLIYIRRSAFLLRWVVTSVCFTYLFCILVTLIYPSVGPCFLDQPNFEWLHESAIGQSQALLAQTYVSNANAVLAGESIQTVAFTGIAAFPSLHVGHMIIMSVVAWRVSKPYMVFMLAIAVLTFIATIGFGWHYAVDAIGGAIIALGVTYLCYKLLNKWANPHEQGTESPSVVR